MDELEYALEWFSFAETDLGSAEYLQGRRPLPVEIICYLCQQSAEKSLKGFLALQGIQPPRIHKLDELCRLGMTYLTDFQDILTPCNLLNRYGVQPRYPREIVIEPENVADALKQAKIILDFVKPLLKK
ncbi:MAG: HEPN domain-containing protein [Candidatus Margulisbacteria bacterium]|jgi:HEPN domain-containing protein|nr:HEPN domain-containing protein [Candidatus Margulisiibacteriota bacterium]